MGHTEEFLPLLIVLGLAFLVPLLIGRFKAVPVVIGELLAGLLLAQIGLLEPQSTATLALFSNIGLAFLMFLAGMEINPDLLFSRSSHGKKTRVSLPVLVLLNYIGTFALAIIGSYVLRRLGFECDVVLVVLVFSATSLGVVLPVIKDKGLINTTGGQAVFLIATAADFLTIIILTIYILLSQHGSSIQILSIFLILIAFMVAARAGTRFFKFPKVQKIINELSQATIQIKVRGSVVLLLIFVVLAESLGVELILGAFLAGILVGLFKSPEDETLVNKLEAFGFGFFIPVFFITTGANLDIKALAENPQNLIYISILFFLSIVIKLLPALLLRLETSWRSTIAAGFVLNTHLSIEIAIAVIGQQAGLLSPATGSAIIVFAIISVIVMPILFNVIQPKVEKQFVQSLRLIYGWENSLAGSVAQQLLDHGDRVEVIAGGQIDTNLEIPHGLEISSKPISNYDPREVETLLVLGSVDEDNLEFCKQAREAGIQHIVALGNIADNLGKYKEMGVQVFLPALYRATLITLLARNPSMFELLASTSDERDLIEITMQNPALATLRLQNIRFPGQSLVISINRNGEQLIPHGSTRLEMGDRISILVDIQSEDIVRRLFAES